MFEVITFDNGKPTYQGNNWVQALTAYHTAVQQGKHVVLWEGIEPVREFHPTLGYDH